MNVYSLSPPEFPTLWASAWGQDQHGYWQASELQGIQQIMRWIPPGTFQMGSPSTEPERDDDEVLHQVTLNQGYWLAETACTQSLWLAVMEGNPSDFTASQENPVDSISWDDCQQFISKANALLPDTFNLRLPTEAEWEYACRANSQTVFSWGDSLNTEQANYDGDYPYANGEKGEYRKQTVEVLSFSTNSWGLYQMHGNVWEWCAGWYGDYPVKAVFNPLGASNGPCWVLRGGSWFNDGHHLRSAFRRASEPANRAHSIGFRLAGG